MLNQESRRESGFGAGSQDDRGPELDSIANLILSDSGEHFFVQGRPFVFGDPLQHGLEGSAYGTHILPNFFDSARPCPGQGRSGFFDTAESCFAQHGRQAAGSAEAEWVGTTWGKQWSANVFVN